MDDYEEPFELRVRMTGGETEVRYSGQTVDMLQCIACVVDSAARNIGISLMETLALSLIMLDGMEYEQAEHEVVDTTLLKKMLRRMRGEDDDRRGAE